MTTNLSLELVSITEKDILDEMNSIGLVDPDDMIVGLVGKTVASLKKRGVLMRTDRRRDDNQIGKAYYATDFLSEVNYKLIKLMGSANEQDLQKLIYIDNCITGIFAAIAILLGDTGSKGNPAIRMFHDYCDQRKSEDV